MGCPPLFRDAAQQVEHQANAVKVLLVGFSPVTALGVETALSRSSGPLRRANLAHAETLPLAGGLVGRGDIALLILDPYRPTFNDGLEFCRVMKNLASAPRILAFSEFHAEREFAFSYISGIDSFVSTTEPPERLAAAAESTLDGKREWVLGSGNDPSRTDTLDSLTAREQEVLWMVSNRCTNEQIGRSLYISPNTVKNHVAAILRKLGAKSRSELFSGAISLGTPFESLRNPQAPRVWATTAAGKKGSP